MTGKAAWGAQQKYKLFMFDVTEKGESAERQKKKDAGHREDHRGNRVIFDQLAHGFGIDLTIVVNSNFREEKGRR